MKKNSRTANSAKNLTASLLSQGLYILLKFLNRTVFISTLGKSYLGISGLFSDILTMLSLTELGLDTAINFKLYKPLAENDTQRVRVLMKFYRYAYTVVGISMLVLGSVLIPLLPSLIKDYATLEPLGINPVLIFLLYLLQSATSYLFFASRSAIIKADQKEYIVTLTNLISQIALNIVQIAVLLTLKNFTLYVLLTIVFGIGQNLVNALIAKRKYPEEFAHTSENISKSELKDTFKDLGAVFASKINTVALKATDNIVLSAFVGLATVGLYSNYLLFYTTIKTLLQRVYNATKASMGNLFAQEKTEKKYKFFKLMNYISILLYGTCAVGIAVVADEFIECWIGKEYIIAQPLSIFIGIEIIFMGIKQNLTQIRNVAGLFRQMWFRPLLGVIINVGLSIGLVQFMGIYGVILGTISADVLTNFLLDPKVIYKYGLDDIKPVSDYYKRNIRYLFELTVVGLIDMLVCRNFLVGHGWASLIVHAGICVLSVPLYMMLAYRRTEEGTYVASTLRKAVVKLRRRLLHS